MATDQPAPAELTAIGAVREALRGYAVGVHFADALHLALSAGEQPFMTFDKALAHRAKKLPLTPDVVLI